MNEVTKRTIQSSKAGAPIILSMIGLFLGMAVAGKILVDGEFSATSEVVEGLFAMFIYVVPAYVGVIATAHAIYVNLGEDDG